MQYTYGSGNDSQISRQRDRLNRQGEKRKRRKDKSNGEKNNW